MALSVVEGGRKERGQVGGYRGIVESFGGELELGETIANGSEKCQIRFIK